MNRSILLLPLIAFFLGCKSEDESTAHRAFLTADPWYRMPPTQFVTGEVKEIPKGEFGLVTLNEVDALKRLSDSPFVEITATETESYLGRQLEGKNGHLTLLRAVVLNEPTGGFSITRSNGNVRVHHGCLGKHPAPMTRRAIIARLPELPTEVYVDCSMAE